MNEILFEIDIEANAALDCLTSLKSCFLNMQNLKRLKTLYKNFTKLTLLNIM